MADSLVAEGMSAIAGSHIVFTSTTVDDAGSVGHTQDIDLAGQEATVAA